MKHTHHVISFPPDRGNDMFCLQKEYILAKPARDAALKAKMEAESLLVEEGPLHADNEWSIRCFSSNYFLFCYKG